MLTGHKWATLIGYGLSGLVILFMLFDGGIKLVPLDVVITATAELGYPPSVALARGLGILGLVCTALYAYPRTSVLGAILLTGYLGGTVATHLRALGRLIPARRPLVHAHSVSPLGSCITGPAIEVSRWSDPPALYFQALRLAPAPWTSGRRREQNSAVVGARRTRQVKTPNRTISFIDFPDRI